jgi:flavin-binding protein dodecin
MPGSVYKIIEVIGTSATSWEDAARNAISAASKSVRDLRIAEVTKLDMAIGDNGAVTFRTRVNLSFRYEAEAEPKKKAKGRK